MSGREFLDPLPLSLSLKGEGDESLPPLREIISKYSLRAEKKLGQNFLLDQNITDKIARLCGDLSDHTVFEIGPGPGGLTRSLLKSNAARVIAIEFDPRAIKALEHLKPVYPGRIEIIHGDALKMDLLTIPAQNRAIIANLPYNIATVLLVGWLRQMRDHPGAYSSMALMFQREVAERIVAAHSTKSYGRLSVLSQWLCDVKIIYDLPPSAFTPPPKVSSAVVQFKPKILPKDAPPFDSVGAVTAAAFGQRRKMIRSSLKSYTEKLAAMNIDTTLRGENLSVDIFAEIAKGL